MFEMKICNDNYGRTKVDKINGEMRKTHNIKKWIIKIRRPILTVNMVIMKYVNEWG